jgi:hypothetical protein
MSVQIGLVTDSEVTENRDAEETSLMLQCEISQIDDVQAVELYTQAGEDYRPVDGSSVVILAAGRAWKIAIASEDGIESIVEKGERLLYSTGLVGDLPEKRATIYLKSDSTIELNGSADFAVAFNDLKAAFDQLKDELNTFIDDYNLHNHPTAPPGVVSTPSVAGTPAAADMSGAKVESVKVP